MNMSHLFIRRPVFASVICIMITLIGGISYFTLPVSQYPEIAPPTIQVTATYPGANAETIAKTVATPIEQEVNGVEGMLYMFSQSTGDGVMQLSVTFAIGTDLEQAQVLVQNRVAIAEARLPEPVRRLGVTTRKSSPDLMMVIHMLSPDNSLDQLYISNYALLQVRDVLSRIDGVGNITIFGAREYSMRIWLDPDRMVARGLTAGEVVDALRAKNIQVSGGTLGQPPIDQPVAFQVALQLQGRLETAEQFEEIIVKTSNNGRVTRVRDIARVELGAREYVTNSYLSGKPAVALGIFQRPGSNALATADALQAKIAELSEQFPAGLGYQIVYNPTEFIAESIDALIQTIFEAVALVVLVILLFLQSWRAAAVPILAIPVSLIGTFAVMAAFGFSINNLTLFGLVLAVGIVVDDAIVVVENVERNLREGMKPRDAAHETMDEVGGALVATSLVLVAVFLPAAAISGISGQFYRQFALTIAVSTLISTFVSLSLSPALCALLLKRHEPSDEDAKSGNPLRRFFNAFNTGFETLSDFYGQCVGRLTRRLAVTLSAYGLLIGGTFYVFNAVPTGFIPAQDQGYLITVVQLPPGSALGRTDAVVAKAEKILLDTPGIIDTASFAGFNGATFTNAPNSAALFAVLSPFEERVANGQSALSILGQAQQRLGAIEEALIFIIPPPPVRGIGNAGGFKMMIQDRLGRGTDVLQQSLDAMLAEARAEPGLTQVFSPFQTGSPQLFVEIDRTRAEKLNIPLSRVFETLEVYLGSAFVNDFNIFGRTYRVTAQAEAEDRIDRDDIRTLRTRSNDGDMVPLGSLVEFRDTAGPDRFPRFNLFPAAEIQGNTAPGVSSGDALTKMEAIAARTLPYGMGYEWTDLSYQQKNAGDTAMIAFVMAVIFVFLVLAAQYESWSIPFAVVLIVPMCLLSAVLGLMMRGMDNNILSQIGFIVLIGLAAKNAILIVEFARQLEAEGKDRWEAAKEACRIRLRPIIMTSLAFILGVLPLVLATGPAAEMRQALGTAVFAGMVGVTLFGLIFTPAFYVLIRGLIAPEPRSEPSHDPNQGKV